VRAWKSLSLGLLLALSLVARATASPAPAPFLAGGTECVAPAPAMTSAVSPALGSEPGADPSAALWATSGGCLQGFCTTVAQCSCPTAQSVSCTGGTCHYTFAGGGGGGGGRTCTHSFCSTSSQCNCSDGSHGTCSGGVCQF
jgi:hypothetical protein